MQIKVELALRQTIEIPNAAARFLLIKRVTGMAKAMEKSTNHGEVREALCYRGVSSIVFPTQTSLSSGAPPFASVELRLFPSEGVSSPLVDSSWVLNCIEPRFPETIASFVNALRLATRRVMRNGAITCGSSRLDDVSRLQRVRKWG